MPFLLDSANREDLEKALELEIISGITTNPQLFYQAGEDPNHRIPELIREVDLPVWVQVPEGELEGMYRWSLENWKLAPRRVIIKVPCTWDGIRLVRRLSVKGISTCVTTIFSASQALVSFQAGADFVAPYVNRATRKGVDGLELIEDIAKVIYKGELRGNVLAASLKSPEEAIKAYQAGARYLTLPYQVLEQLLDSNLTLEALQTFRDLPGGKF